MTALQRLGLSKMLLAEVPVELCSLPNLKFLDLSSNPRLNELPQEIRSLKKMERLNLAGTNIADIPPEIVESLKTLVLFDFPAVRIARRLPEALWLSQSIEELDLRNDGIRATAEDLARLPNLKILRVRPGEEEGSLSLNALQSALPNCKIDTRGAFDSYHWFEEEGT